MGLWQPTEAAVAAGERFIERVKSKGMPAWVNQLDGPLRHMSVREAVREFHAHPPQALLQIWGRRYLGHELRELRNFCGLGLRYFDGTPELDYLLVIVDTDDAMRISRQHVSKDAKLGPIQQVNVVNTPDTQSWRQQRAHLLDAFLPTKLSKTVPKLTKLSTSLVQQWNTGGLIDVRAWMHHAALAMFVSCMMGDDKAFGPVDPDFEPGVKMPDLYDGEDDLEFHQTTPANSAPARSIFNLEGAGRVRSAEETERRISAMGEYASKLLTRAEERTETIGTAGPLIDRLLTVDPALRLENMAATLIAGHDTTAYTMQYCLLELARNQPLQDRLRTENNRILSDIEARGTPLSFTDIPNFKLMTRTIFETLRLWQVASAVFPRVTGFSDGIKGSNGKTNVEIPQDTFFTFWFYAHHHSAKLWGDDVMEFNPDRDWKPLELQQPLTPALHPLQGTALTPHTHRFHPFSLPSRDCLGKNFALSEMRVLLPQILRAFRVELPDDDTQQLATVNPHAEHPAYYKWACEIGGPVQPHNLWLKLTPINPSKSRL